jgi:lipoprotein-anchoring transpeptidase ErfK/SrfK
MYWVRFNGSYLFHSIAMDRYQNIKDDTLGDRATAGCIRLSLEDSQWFYENIPSGTGVYVN